MMLDDNQMELENPATWYSQAKPADQAEFRQWLKGLLQSETVKLTFEKADGSDRVMRATLKSGVVPLYERKTERVRTPNPELCSVYDLEKREWRSFRFDKVKRIEFTLGEET
jgi:hypothetical protein